MLAAKIALALSLAGVVLIVHGFGRAERISFESGRLVGVIVEIVAGAACVVAGAATALGVLLLT